MLAWIILGLGVFLGLVCYRLGRNADWSQGGAIIAGVVPIAFCFFAGIFGLVISVIFLGAIWKAASS